MEWIATGMCMLAIFSGALEAAARKIPLPTPRTKGPISLEETFGLRQSIRSFRPDALNLQEVSQLLWSVQGKTHNGLKRTAPSAGATYPLEVYLSVRMVEGLRPGVYRYLTDSHALQLLRSGDVSRRLQEAAWEQDFIGTAPIHVVIAAVFERTTRRYGERGNRYVHMEAGHSGQNLYLQAAALGLGTVAVGAFEDDRVQSVLGIREPVLYLFPVGRIQK